MKSKILTPVLMLLLVMAAFLSCETMLDDEFQDTIRTDTIYHSGSWVNGVFLETKDLNSVSVSGNIEQPTCMNPSNAGIMIIAQGGSWDFMYFVTNNGTTNWFPSGIYPSFPTDDGLSVGSHDWGLSEYVGSSNGVALYNLHIYPSFNVHSNNVDPSCNMSLNQSETSVIDTLLESFGGNTDRP